MSRVKEMLKKHFPDVTFSQIVKSPDYTNNVGAPYSNCVAKGTTILSETDLVATLKSMERQLGRTQSEQIMMDLDLLQFNNTRHHLADWSRPHIKRLLSILLILIIGITYAFPRTPPSDADNKAARELLIKATEYFQGSKYHEAVLCFEKLQERYTLTPRYLAYLGCRRKMLLRYFFRCSVTQLKLLLSQPSHLRNSLCISMLVARVSSIPAIIMVPSPCTRGCCTLSAVSTRPMYSSILVWRIICKVTMLLLYHLLKKPSSFIAH